MRKLSSVIFSSLIVLYCSVFIVCSAPSTVDFSYDDKDNRDPFIPLVGPGAIYQSRGGADIQTIHDVILEGIVYDRKRGSIVVINGIVLKEGEQIGAAMIKKIEPKQVVLEIKEKQYEVPLIIEEEGGN